MTQEELKYLAQNYLQPYKMIYLIVEDKTTHMENLKILGFSYSILLDKDRNKFNY
jgi:hypothetical protein